MTRRTSTSKNDRRPIHKGRVAILCGSLAIALCSCQKNAVPETNDPSGSRVTFTRDIAPIVYQKCAHCHRPGEAAPFSLLSYEDVRRRATQIVEVTQKRFMPPWLPTPGKGDFVDARRLTNEELATFAHWASAGAPLGAATDAPPPPEFTAGWQLGTPDLVIESPEFSLTGEGGDVFRNFVVPIPLDSSRWIRSIELRPENPRVTHHARLGVDASGESIRRDAEDDEPGYAGMAWGQDPDGQLIIWAPGMIARPGLAGVAWRLDPSACLVLHTHLQPSGKTETVKFRIGVHFADGAPQTFPAMLRIGSRDIDIPAGEANHVVEGEYTLPIDMDLQRIFPHAHSLCKALSVVAERPDGSREPLIEIKRFDENWHESYVYQRPIRLPRGTKVLTTFAYDNTAENAKNRNHPPRRVVYGSNVTDEMADVYLQVTCAEPDQRAALMESYKRRELESQLVGLRKSLELFPDDPWAQEGIAACHVGLGQPREAIPILEQRVKISPLAVFPRVSLGLALLASGDAAAAETQERQALALDDAYPLAWFGLGQAFAAQQKFEPAEEALRRAVELAPSLLEARLSLADLLLRQNRLTAAAYACSAALVESPEAAGAYLKLAEIAAKERRYAESLESCKQARRLAPYIHPPQVLLASFCFQNGDQEQALNLLREARSEFPEHPAPTLILGQFALRDGQLDEARKLFAVSASKTMPENWPDSYRRRFLTLLYSEQFQLAKQLRDESLARESIAAWLKADPESQEAQRLFKAMGAADQPASEPPARTTP